MTTRTLAIALTWLLALSATAQDAVRTFHDAVVKHHLYLRDFSIDPRTHGHWDAATGTLVMDAPHLHSLADFAATSLKVKGSSVEIKGNSHTLVRETATHLGLLPDDNQMVIQLDLRGADMDAVLPGLFSLLFYASQDEALAAIPPRYRSDLPTKVSKNCCGLTASTGPRPHACDCADPEFNACMADGMGNMKGAKPPRLIHAVDPEFSEKARQAKFSGNVKVGFEVDTAGLPSDLWIIRGVGMGLDAKAVEAVSQYKFAPATCRGTPIATTLSVDVNFQIF